MAYYAKIGVGSIVTTIHTVDNYILLKDGAENEQQGIEFLHKLHKNNDLYVQTSYNGTFRKNYAGVGYKYDQTRDAFIAPQPYPSWVLDEDTCQWDAPTPYPDDGKHYDWDEDTTNWREL
jgi:hypothetical protein